MLDQDFQLIYQVIALIEEFHLVNTESSYSRDIGGFRRWIAESESTHAVNPEPAWEGKENGRTAESAISTLLVQLNRYAKTYSKSAIYGSDFSTQDDFIYLINLRSLGPMTKMELIHKNLQDKPTGMLIISRLIKNGWVFQQGSETDRRSKLVSITAEGLRVLELQLDKIRQASDLVSGNLNKGEKMELIRLLTKLRDFHHPIFLKNLDPHELLSSLASSYPSPKN